MELTRKQNSGSLLLAAILAVGASPFAYAQPSAEAVQKSPTILERSPFIPPGWAPPESRQGKTEAKQPETGYEFRGIYQLGSEYRFLVSQPRSRNGKWVKLGTDYEDYEVRRYDPETETLTLYYNSKEEGIKLASLDANPTPMPVSGQIRRPEDAPGSRTVRRTIRPATRSSAGGSEGPPPPPAWLQKLREEAAQRRAQSGQSGSSSTAAPDSRLKASGSTSGPPSGPPPAPPPDLLNLEIPPVPTELPPPPPPEVQERMLQSLSGNYGGPSG